LDVALELGIPCGGWCPKGREAEDGPIPDRYPLQETHSLSYSVRTEMNVRDSDGTLILTMGNISGGTALTLRAVKQFKRPYLIVDLLITFDPVSVTEWAEPDKIRVLNVAGPRETEVPGIYDKAVQFLREIFE
jgi:hypothetical protein